MDPNTCIQLLLDLIASIDAGSPSPDDRNDRLSEIQDLASSLFNWISRGGSHPENLEDLISALDALESEI